MLKIKITKKDGSAKVEEVNRNIFGISNSCSLKTGKPAGFKKELPYALFPIHLSIPAPTEVVGIQERANQIIYYWKTYNIIATKSLQIMQLL